MCTEKRNEIEYGSIGVWNIIFEEVEHHEIEFLFFEIEYPESGVCENYEGADKQDPYNEQLQG